MDEQESSRSVSIRLPPALVDEIDALVQKQRFKSRSSFFEQVALRYMEDIDPAAFEKRLIRALQSEEVRQKMREMNSEIVTAAFTNLLRGARDQGSAAE